MPVFSATHHHPAGHPTTPRCLAPGGFFILEPEFMSTLFTFSRLFVTRPVLVLASALLYLSSAQAAGPSGLLNDTGQTQCDNGSNVLDACNAASTGDGTTLPRQDGRFGRDVASPVKVGGGAAGFDFSKVCFNGDVQGSGTCTGALVANTSAAATGTPSTDWACT
ncbi:MAG: hypothetical protein Q8R49_01285, partial [Rhodoferax sp.]|nr:hypothetical protein [Rhodoferax sp.]